MVVGRSFEVLYFKRVASNKVHRQRGVSTMDGILTISGDHITLKHASTLDQQSDDNSDDETIKKSLWRKQRGSKSNHKSSLYSGTQGEIAKRELNVDDTIVLGGFEVQIVSVLAASPHELSPMASGISNHHLSKNPLIKKLDSIAKKPTTKLLGKRKSFAPTSVLTISNGSSRVIRQKMHPMEPSPSDSYSSKTFSRALCSEADGSISHTSSACAGSQQTEKQQLRVSQGALLQKLTKTPPRIFQRKVVLSRSLPRPETTVSPKTNDPPTLNPHVVMSSQIPLPASVRSIMRPHQVTGVEFLWKTLHEKHGCILGDEMGLGKTLMTIATVAALHRLQRHKVRIDRIQKSLTYLLQQQYIVVCPSSLIVNWADEFDKWLGQASQPKRVVIRNGGQEGLQQIRAYTSSMKMNLKHHAGQVLIVSYDLLRRNVDEFVFPDHTSIRLLVCDESHRLKSSTGSQTLSALESLHADARLCITATPIQNNLSEFFNLSSFCCPGILGPDLATFRSTFDRPIAAANQKNATPSAKATGQLKSKELEAISKTFMLRRMQKDILKAMLPPRLEVLLFCRLSTVQTELYHRLSSRAVATYGMTEALQTLTSLRKVCCHPTLLENSERRQDPSISGKVIVLNALLKEIRKQAPHDKVVVVSNFTSALTVIENCILLPNKMQSLRLDGSSKHRQSMVDSFNRSKPEQCFCFLLSSKAGGCGLNLVDPDWNPSNDIQATGRVYRQGQTKPCIIYRMFSTGTLEEVIYQRQNLKGGLSSLTVDAGSTAHDAKFSKEEIKDCFTLKENCQCDTKLKLGKRWDDYSGPESFKCNDPPLNQVARSCRDVLSYVHIVEEAETAVRAEKPASIFKLSDLDSGSDEEFELSCSANKKPAESSDDEFEL